MHTRHAFDVAVSYAGEDRALVDPIVELLQAKRLRVFYDQAKREHLWGRGLRGELAQVYKDDARYVLAFISSPYLDKDWTKFELSTALARTTETSDGSLLIVKVPPVALPPDVQGFAYFSIGEVSASEIVQALVAKLHVSTQSELIDGRLASPEPDERVQAIMAMTSFGDDRFLSELSGLLLTDGSAEVRAKAAWALDQLHSEAAIPVLVTALRDPDWNVRSGAGWALVHLGEAARAAVQDAVATLPNADARDMAALVLERI